MTLNKNLQNIGKFKIGNKSRTIYKLKKQNKIVYYYRKNIKNKKGTQKSVKVYLKKKPKDYSSKFINYKYNKGSKSKSFDVYIDKNPKDTISIKYSTLKETKETIKKLEKLYKSRKYSHKRIWQVGMILHVRLRGIKQNKNSKNSLKKRKEIAKKYFNFLRKRTKTKGKNKEETFLLRKKMVFKF